VLHYLKDTEHPNLQHLVSIQRLDREDYLWMDRFTIRNLELTGTAWGQDTSLHKVLDNTVSPMGARLLKRWLLLPGSRRAAGASSEPAYLSRRKME